MLPLGGRKVTRPPALTSHPEPLRSVTPTLQLQKINRQSRRGDQEEKRALEVDSELIQMLELSDTSVKIIIINMLRKIVGIMLNFTRELESIKRVKCKLLT